MAKDQRFDGGILFGLHNETKKENGTFKTDCTDLGITASSLANQAEGTTREPFWMKEKEKKKKERFLLLPFSFLCHFANHVVGCCDLLL